MKTALTRSVHITINTKLGSYYNNEKHYVRYDFEK